VTTLRASIAGSANPMPLVNVGMAGAPNASVTTFINMALQAAGLGSKVAPASKPVTVPVTPGSTCNMTCANYCKVSLPTPACASPHDMHRLALQATLCGLALMQLLRLCAMPRLCPAMRPFAGLTPLIGMHAPSTGPTLILLLTPFMCVFARRKPRCRHPSPATTRCSCSPPSSSRTSW